MDATLEFDGADGTAPTVEVVVVVVELPAAVATTVAGSSWKT